MSIGKLIAYTLRRFFDFGHEQRIPCPCFQSYETTDLTIKKMTYHFYCVLGIRDHLSTVYLF